MHRAGARAHGRQLLKRGFTVDQVVHDYGDVCQSVTELAVETDTAISAEDFRTLNQCLDDAIAGAVTAFAEVQDIARDGELFAMDGLVAVGVRVPEGAVVPNVRAHAVGENPASVIGSLCGALGTLAAAAPDLMAGGEGAGRLLIMQLMFVLYAGFGLVLIGGNRQGGLRPPLTL